MCAWTKKGLKYGENILTRVRAAELCVAQDHDMAGKEELYFVP